MPMGAARPSMAARALVPTAAWRMAPVRKDMVLLCGLLQRGGVSEAVRRSWREVVGWMAMKGRTRRDTDQR